jgi:Alpha/beta hydrolase domain
MRRLRNLWPLLLSIGILGQGGAPVGPQLPSTPVMATMPTFKGVNGPGPMFPALLALPAEEDLAHFKYVTKEYFVSGIAQGQPYTTRLVVRRPTDYKKFSGIVVAEPMHPTGNDWMFHFMHTYLMSQGHVAVEIATSGVQLFKDANAARYKDIEIGNTQVNEILAQVGLLLKNDRPDGPLEGLPMRKMVLAGTSASAAAVVAYLPAHMAYRGEGMKPIFDGFLPTSIGDNTIMKVDVPVVQMPTMTEVVRGAATGNRYRRPDGDAAGDQFRIYEVAGMAHIDSRVNPVYTPNPCKHEMSMFPVGMGLAAGLERLIQWVDKGKTPPRAEYVTVDNNTANDGSPLALDANGNPKGGVRNPYVDVPAYRYVAPNEPAAPPIPNPSPMVAGQGPDGPKLFCGIAAYQVPLSADQMKTLYKTRKDYESKVEQRTNTLIKDGWVSPAYKDLILADAAKVEFR